MPTENERKYVIDKSCEDMIAKLSMRAFNIVQGYFSSHISNRLQMTTRIRSKNDDYYFTLKTKVEDRVIEIEKKIDKRDFDDLWNLVESALKKVRYLVYDANEGLVWEIDFFKDSHNRTYLAVAEIELQEGILEPASIPNFLQDYLIYEVPLDDLTYSNYNLSKESR